MRTLVLYGPPIVMVAISALYFHLDRRQGELRDRILSSIHGALGTVLYLGAMAVWKITGAHHPGAVEPFLLCYVAPLASVSYALFRFRGPKTIHLLQVINIAALLWTGLVGAMAIKGTWL